MIDYNKLKQAHEMCLNTKYYFDIALGVEDGGIALFDCESNISFINNPEDLDDLIVNLKKLTGTKPKYSEIDFVWVMDGDHDFEEVQIMYLSSDHAPWHYAVKFKNGMQSFFSEDKLFPSKYHLIAAQIRYWARIGAKEPEESETEECPHDKKIMGLGNDFICKHCDEYVNNEECEHDYQPNNYGQSNLEYQCTKCKVWKECQHESDGEVNLQQYSDMSARTEYFKCKKCGEFYR